jgi:hypothetical protein
MRLKTATELDGIGLHIYILSDDEIQMGDWYVRLFDKTLQKANPNSDHKHYDCKKIIASTNKRLIIDNGFNADAINYQELPQPTNTYIDYFVSEYNKGNQLTKALVWCKEFYACAYCFLTSGFIECPDKSKCNIKMILTEKINENNTITILIPKN